MRRCLGGVAITSVVFDACSGWFRFAHPARSRLHGPRRSAPRDTGKSVRCWWARALPTSAGVIGSASIVLQCSSARSCWIAMGGQSKASPAPRWAYFAIRIWSAPYRAANFVVLGWLIGQARAGLALAIQIGGQCHQHGRNRCRWSPGWKRDRRCGVACLSWRKRSGSCLASWWREPSPTTAQCVRRRACSTAPSFAHAVGQSRHHESARPP